MKIGIYTDIASIGYPARLDYVLDFINQHPLKPASFSIFLTNEIHSASIFYGRSQPNKITFKKADFLFDQKKPSDFHLNKHRWQKQLFYSIGAFESNDPIQPKHIPFDLFETIFFFLSRIEELHLPFSAYVSRKELFESNLIGVKTGINHIPVVDQLVLLFFELVTQQKIQENTTISISHDIDSIRKYNSPYSFLRKMGGQLIHRKNISRWPIIWKQAKESPQKDPFDTSEWMLSTQEDQSKEIYFLCGGTHKEDHTYSLNDPIFKQYLSRAIERGYEIGIHPSYGSWNKKEMILEEKNKLESILGKPVSISRQHFLNFDIHCTPGILDSCGIYKDSSIGFSRHVGFRSGTGFEHYLYDFEKECPSILENPLVFMDVAGMHHCHWDGDRFVDLQKSFLAENAYNTHITFLYHNTIFDELEMRGFDLKPYYHNLISNDRQ
jgi:hypothetical protein